MVKVAVGVELGVGLPLGMGLRTANSGYEISEIQYHGDNGSMQPIKPLAILACYAMRRCLVTSVVRYHCPCLCVNVNT